MIVLDVQDCHSFYGKSHVLQGVSLRLEKGSFVCLLGRNGVGKTTLLHSIMGMVKPKAGRITLRGENLTGLEPFQIARKGVGLVPETRRIFPSLTVEQNLLMGMLGKKSSNRVRTEADWTIEKIYAKFPRLEERKNQGGNQLSGGEQQMLTIARTLMGNPEVLLVDEPTEGLAPVIAKAVLAMLTHINASGVTILIVEQNMKMAVKHAGFFYVMGKGTMVFQGDKDALLANEGVKKQYLEI
jgi:branched-chain amino acid transport system ATP-binding protein